MTCPSSEQPETALESLRLMGPLILERAEAAGWPALTLELLHPGGMMRLEEGRESYVAFLADATWWLANEVLFQLSMRGRGEIRE